MEHQCPGNLEKLDPIIRERILTKVSWLEENLADIVPEPLHRELKGSYKLRMGDYRVVTPFTKNLSPLRPWATAGTCINKSGADRRTYT